MKLISSVSFLFLTLTTVISFADVRTEAYLRDLYRNEKVVTTTPLDERVVMFANMFVSYKSPYIENPLGDGYESPHSPGPLYRFDGFDCTTFVETVLALAFSRDDQEFKKTINQIRYRDGVVSFEMRNHFTSLDWIPNNSKYGFIEDITKVIGGGLQKLSETWIDKGRWFAKKGPQFQFLAQNYKTELALLPYIPKQEFLRNDRMLEKIPNVSIFNIVRPNWNLTKTIGTRLDVSHQGFLVKENGVIYMVHASNGITRDGSDNSQRVKKEALSDYVRRVMLPSPSTAGLNILGLPK